MVRAWRIVKAKYAGSAFDGQGAFDYGGRWNSKGSRVVYLSSSRSLATLEILAHLKPLNMSQFMYVSFEVNFDEFLMESYPIANLPNGWDAMPPTSHSQTIGDEWLNRGTSPILQVPSVIIPEEANYLLNIAHPDFKKISIGKKCKFAIDPRLL